MHTIKIDIPSRGARVELCALESAIGSSRDRSGSEIVEIVVDQGARVAIEADLHRGSTSGTVRAVVGWRRVGAMQGVTPDLETADVPWAVDS